MSHIFCYLALLCFASCVAENTETEQAFKDLQLQQDSMSWLKRLQDKRESTKTWKIVELLSDIFKSENGIILHESKDTEKQEKNRRELSGRLTTRKAGCRVFFWKSWTSC
ncbi:somatostatin-1-like [Solea solea]|uniref:somatostatin-1-like n=1 Tax=Solea solea TaxID=90069 RepID=UPI00272A1EBF|nr:somatostatin-1-like [Solea solea]